MKDPVLLPHPLLHADVIVYRLDDTFAAGSELYSKDSRTADWERMTRRLPGEDVVTLATRVTEAFLKRLSDSKYNTVTIWDHRQYSMEMIQRFADCLQNDPTGPPERADNTANKFWEHVDHFRGKIARSEEKQSDFNIITIASRVLQPAETTFSRMYSLSDIDDDADDASTTSESRAYRRPGTTGRGARAKRMERRLALQQ